LVTTPIIEVTPLAAAKLEDVVKKQGKEDGKMLRVMVMPGPDGSVQYMLGLEKEAKADDFIVDTETIQVLVDSESVPLVEGSQIDYVDGLMRSGFVISNPNFHAGGGCGCGGGGGGGCGGGGEGGGGGGGCGCGGGGGGGCGGGGGGGCGCGGGGGGGGGGEGGGGGCGCGGGGEGGGCGEGGGGGGCGGH